MRGVFLRYTRAASSVALFCAALGAQAPQGPAVDRAKTVRELEAWTHRAGTRGAGGEANFRIAEGLLRLHRAGASTAGTPGLRLGEAYISGIYRNLVASLRADPDFRPARDLAATLLLARGEREAFHEEQQLLRILAMPPSLDPRALIVLARDSRAAQHIDSAAVLLQSARAAGGDPSLIALEMARVHEARGNRAAALAGYWEGLKSLTPLSRAWYRYDLGWLLTADSLAAFDTVADSALPDWLGRFWRQRDAASAGYEGDRLYEHLHRWRIAVQNYRVPQAMRKTQFGRVEVLFEDLDQCIASNGSFYEQLASNPPVHPDDARERELLLDHRGLVTLRHGEPVHSMFTPGRGLPYVGGMLFEKPDKRGLAERGAAMDQSMFPNETWVFWINGGLRELHFRGSQALGFHAPTTLSSFLPLKNPYQGNYVLDWSLRGSILPSYGAAASVFGTQPSLDPMCHPVIKQVIATSRVNASVAISTDSDTPPPARNWNAVVQLFALGSSADRSGRMLLSYAIPLTALESDTLPDGRVVIRTAFRLVAYERGSGQVIEIDSTRRVVTAGPAGKRDHLTGLMELGLPAGDWQVAVRAGQPLDSIGLYTLHPRLRIPDGDALSISDIVTGLAGSAPVWQVRGLRFPVNALGAWPIGASVELYAEIHGAAPGEDVRVAIEVIPTGDNGGEGIRITSTERAEGPSITMRRTLNLEQLPAGQHTIRLTAEQGGRTATQARSIVIYRPEPEVP